MKKKMGRPKQDLTRPNIVSMRFTDAEKETLTELSEMLGMCYSDTIRHCIRKVYFEETRNRKYTDVDTFCKRKVKKIS